MDEKRIKQAEKKARYEEREEKAQEYYEKVIYYSKIRKQVLKRDKETCQICKKKKKTKLHIHHIIKKTEGRNDCLDNLITCCPSCHKLADGKLYNPEWT